METKMTTLAEKLTNHGYTYVRCDYDECERATRVVVTTKDGNCRDIEMFSRKANAEILAAHIAKANGCEWGCNY